MAISNYPSSYDPYMDRPRSQREYEEMMWHKMKQQEQAAKPTQQAAPAPEKAKHLNTKLLLTKGA